VPPRKTRRQARTSPPPSTPKRRLRAASARAALAAGALALAALAGAERANGHAILTRAEPPPGATLRDPPAEVKLWFSGDLEPAFSSVQVLDTGGRRVDQGDSRVDNADRGLLRVGLPRLDPGRYRVVWRVVAVDTHVSRGELAFQVAP
jgi:hypothetical protein